jgi:hypothetical protein
MSSILVVALIWLGVAVVVTVSTSHFIRGTHLQVRPLNVAVIDAPRTDLPRAVPIRSRSRRQRLPPTRQ